jgi:hypothetical protein
LNHEWLARKSLIPLTKFRSTNGFPVSLLR